VFRGTDLCIIPFYGVLDTGIPSSSSTLYCVIVFSSFWELWVEWETCAFGLGYFIFASSYILSYYMDTANLPNILTYTDLDIDGFGD
jgi:hypothetical protein